MLLTTDSGALQRVKSAPASLHKMIKRIAEGDEDTKSGSFADAGLAAPSPSPPGLLPRAEKEMGDVNCSGPREGPWPSCLEPTCTVRGAREWLASAREQGGESDTEDGSAVASRDQTLGPARSADTEWLDDAGVPANTRCEGAATALTTDSGEVTWRGEATAIGLGPPGVTTEWLDDVGVSDKGGPAVQTSTSTSAPAWVSAFADVTLELVDASLGTRWDCQPQNPPADLCRWSCAECVPMATHCCFTCCVRSLLRCVEGCV